MSCNGVHLGGYSRKVLWGGGLLGGMLGVFFAMAHIGDYMGDYYRGY